MKKSNRSGKLGLVVLAAVASMGWGSVAVADTWRLEAEAAGEGSIWKTPPVKRRPNRILLEVMEADDASGGKYLGGKFMGETHPVTTRIPHAGAYQVWVRHYATPGKPTSFFMLFRNDIRAAAGLRFVDFVATKRNLTARPRDLPEPAKDAKPQWAWSPFDYTFERPMNATVSFGGAGGEQTGTLGIDCVVVTDDSSYDPGKVDWSKLPAEPGPAQPAKEPKGLRPAPAFTLHSSFFAGAPDRKDQIKLTMVHGMPLYYDYPTLLQWGWNRDRSWRGGSVEYGIQTQASTSEPYYAMHKLLREVPSPEGRRVSSNGKLREKRFSLAYEPYRKVLRESFRKGVKAYHDMVEVERFSVTGESGGVFDYSPVNRAGFHRWLEKRLGSIAKLNELWRTEYQSFDDMELPKTPEPDDNKAAWFAFRKYNSELMCGEVADKVAAVNDADKHGRQPTCQASCLHINSPWFTSTGPLDYEDLITIGFAESKLFGYDAYSSADYFVGCDLELLLSFTGDRDVLNGEFNTHGQDPRTIAAAYWGMIAKGVAGIDIWQLQDHPRNWVYSMWAMLKPDGTPRDKLAAAADANHEIHRLERLLRPARRQQLVKPVALYYSRMDLSLPQPLFDIYGSAIDSPYRVYEVLRGLGYAVRWISPRQIESGELKDVGAVAMVGVKYVPHEAATKLAEWVEGGGCLIGDAWPGAYDQYDRPQGTLAPVFGVRALEGKAPKQLTPEQARVALAEQATPVYGVDQSLLKSLAADEFYKSVDEMFNQRDSEHPVAKAVGDWHLSGYDGKSVQVLSGEIIGQMMGRPGIVVNDYGQGHTLYSAVMLGTLYEAGPVRYEWDSGREGPAFRNLLGAFLDYSGLEPFATPALPWGMARKMRIEPPLIDSQKNVLVGMISLNDGPLNDFPLTLAWPESAPKPKMMLACVSGSRRMQRVPFEAKDGKLTLTMPGFDTHVMLLALQQSDPLVSLDVEGAPRGIAGLLEVTPGTRLKIKATVWNPSPRKLSGGDVKIYAAPGWFTDKASAPVGAIDAWGHAEASFEVAPPAVCAAKALHPIVVKYGKGQNVSTPCNELVWWLPSQR